jgi:hypothetical protein
MASYADQHNKHPRINKNTCKIKGEISEEDEPSWWREKRMSSIELWGYDYLT